MITKFNSNIVDEKRYVAIFKGKQMSDINEITISNINLSSRNPGVDNVKVNSIVVGPTTTSVSLTWQYCNNFEDVQNIYLNVDKYNFNPEYENTMDSGNYLIIYYGIGQTITTTNNTITLTINNGETNQPITFIVKGPNKIQSFETTINLI